MHQLGEKLRTQLTRDEGRVPYAYTDSLGYWTIGIGHLIDQRKGGKLDDEVIDLQFEMDVNRANQELREALPWVENLDEARIGALINMRFQLGMAGLLSFRNSLLHIRFGNWQAAHDNLLLSRWHQQTPNRAKRIAKQILTGTWQ